MSDPKKKEDLNVLLQRYVHNLSSSRASDKRCRAALALGKLGDVRAVEALIRALRDEHPDVCIAVAEALGELGDIRAVDPLIRTLQDADMDDSIAAAEQYDEEFLPFDEDFDPFDEDFDPFDEDFDPERYSDIPIAAAEALGKLGDARAVEPLIRVLQGTDSHVRLAISAAEALGRLGDERAIEPLSRAQKDDDSRLRYYAAKALAQLDGFEPLIRALEDAKARDSALQELAKSKNHQAIKRLICALGHRSWLVRQVAAETLGKLKVARAVEPLSRTLEDENSAVRSAAARALAQLHDFEPLVRAVGGVNATDAAVEELAKWGDRRVIEPVTRALRHHRIEVRRAAAQALCKLKAIRSIEHLIRALQDTDSVVRRISAEALGKLGDARAVEPLACVLQDLSAKAKAFEDRSQTVKPLVSDLKDADVHLAVAVALARLGDMRGIEALMQWLCTRSVNMGANQRTYIKQASTARHRAAEELVKLAAENPGVLRPHWQKVAAKVMAPHGDSVYSGTCGFISHTDYGIGLVFPRPPAEWSSPPGGLKLSDKTISLSCPNCGKRLKTPRHHAGKTGRCPGCNGVFRIPEQSAGETDVKPDF